MQHWEKVSADCGTQDLLEMRGQKPGQQQQGREIVFWGAGGDTVQRFVNAAILSGYRGPGVRPAPHLLLNIKICHLVMPSQETVLAALNQAI
jgi:hypothetical protein